MQVLTETRISLDQSHVTRPLFLFYIFGLEDTSCPIIKSGLVMQDYPLDSCNTDDIACLIYVLLICDDGWGLILSATHVTSPAKMDQVGTKYIQLKC